jgi:hypothetical protein
MRATRVTWYILPNVSRYSSSCDLGEPFGAIGGEDGNDDGEASVGFLRM